MQLRHAWDFCINKIIQNVNIVLTGSLGHISKPLTELLIEKGHAVTVISSNAGRQPAIEALGAKAAIGSIDDAAFLAKTFQGADIVYLMEPPFNYFDQEKDVKEYWLAIARNYVQAVQQSGVTRIIHLSSIGAHTDKGVGMLATHYRVENMLQELPETVAIKTMRPVGFYYNMFAFIPAIKNAGAIVQNYGGDEKEPWVAPHDIAAVVAEEMELPFQGRTVRYIASDEASPNEVAALLGAAIGKPGLKWTVISNEQFRNNLIQAGFNPQAAKGFTEMNAGRVTGLYDDYNRNKPKLGSRKLKDFATEFAAVYNA